MKRLAAALLLLGLGSTVTAHAAEPSAARLSAIADRQEIEQLMTGDYPRALDEHHWGPYAALFTADAQLSFSGQSLTGSAAIERFFVAQEASKGSVTATNASHDLHVVTNLSIHLEGNTATAGAYWQSIGQRDGHPVVLSAGHYDDVLRKVDGHWKFAKRVIVTDVAAPATPAPR